MGIRYLLDEHISPSYRLQLIRRAPDLVVWLVGDPGAPPRGASDSVILEWCESNGFLLVTADRKSMPRHSSEHILAGRKLPGVLLFGPDAAFGEIPEDLLLIAGASDPEEYSNLLIYLPLS